jgi:hypothetical protein
MRFSSLAAVAIGRFHAGQPDRLSLYWRRTLYDRRGLLVALPLADRERALEEMRNRMSSLVSEMNSVLCAELPSLPGFEPVRPRRWVGSAKAPIREIFEFQALKGATYSARWGFSLDFVPVIRNGRATWKRTSKSAEFDLCIDPVDELGAPAAWCSFVQEEIKTAAFIRIAATASRAARRDFDRVESINDVVAIFSERASMSFRRFSLENYIQTHLAWGLGLIAVGESKRGAEHVKEFCERQGLDRELPSIRKAEHEAAKYAAVQGPDETLS